MSGPADGAAGAAGAGGQGAQAAQPAQGGKPVGPYTPVQRVGDWVITSGQVGAVPGPDGKPKLVDGGTGAELQQALSNVENLLAQQGATLADVVKTTVFLADMSDYAVLNEIWIAFWPEPRPTRSAVGVASLPIGARIEVEAWAYKPRS